MKVKEIIEREKNNFDNFEVWQYTDKTERLHTDYIKNIDEEFSNSAWENLEAKNSFLMNEQEYNETILCNSSVKADFKEWYDDSNARVLVIMLGFNEKLEV